jgi:hypothetical protein
MLLIRTYESLLKDKIKELDRFNPIYTLSGGIDSSLIFSYLKNPECFCVQVNGNEDYEYAKKLYPSVIKIEFNKVDVEKILTEIQSIWEVHHCMMSDMYDYFVYQQFPGRMIIVGEEPRYDADGKDMTKEWRKLFFRFRPVKVDSPYMYNTKFYSKEIVIRLARERLPEFICNRIKRNYSGPNPVWITRHQDQIDHLKKKYNIIEDDFNTMWRKLNLAIWRNIH